MYGDLKILTGTANPQLAMDICDHLGCALTPALCETFSDGELRVEIGASVRGHDVFVIQPTCAPTNRNLMQLCLMLDALKRASAGRITAVIPYYGYARQDRKVSPRAPISAKMVADFLSMAGAQRIVTVDLHAGQIQGFFNCPVDNLFASPVLLQYVRHLRGDLVMVSPDAGGVERTRAFAKKMDAGLAIIDKRRDRPNQATAMNVVGDVAGKVAVLVDDMIDTAGTICAAAEVLLQNGASEVRAPIRPLPKSWSPTPFRWASTKGCATSCAWPRWPVFWLKAYATSMTVRPSAPCSDRPVGRSERDISSRARATHAAHYAAHQGE